jgi:hypothetical protein
LEGFTIQSLIIRQKAAPRELKPHSSLKKTQWQDDPTFHGLLWMSVVTFLEKLFAYHPFDLPSPTFINRPWILHGRSATEWTAADALKLVNALATLEWLFT